MQLFYSPTSPYARKCRALIIEKSLESKIELVEVSPLDDPAALHAANPLGKVPALIRKSGPALINSPLICEFIDTLNDDRWIPANGESRILVLRQQAVADGLMDLTIGRRIEMNRPANRRYKLWTERWERGIVRTLEQLDRERGQFERSVDHGALSIAVALSYLDLRYAELDWRAAHPELGAFLERWEQRDSIRLTAPPTVT
ncbi:glutathione S-transferase domain-containing protein [Glycocaulis alkaliphilus]|uniref:Glutathione S-transferase domain-containing protein n=1 Tax=Glycocaulis alkaliphilus TaxID=1434191 RepID=A0A3T0EAC9_9PROT|nr:glutathione S-transferase [Glycocaulis alkaliphilus]AZU04254.1 glutathione S-transferase domain-containing protein [Glycocaulis alkaliphilus]GGB77000.1 glutathione S-transferase [Glycocaulis alkaliphilus]